MKNRKKCLSSFALLSGIGLIGSIAHTDVAYANTNSDRIPELNAYQQNNHVKLEWAVSILDSNILYSSSFEDGEQIPNFIWGANSSGGQSHTSDTASQGSKSLKVVNTIANGNHYNFPQTTAINSIMVFNRLYFENGTPLSLTFKAKSNSIATIIPNGDGGWGTSISDIGTTKISSNVPASSTTIPVTSTEGLYIGSYITTDTNPDVITSMYQITNIDYQNKTFTVHSPINRSLVAGEQLKARTWRGAWGFNPRTVQANKDWELFSINTFVADHADYDVKTRGGSFYINTNTNGTLYIDELTFGYSTQSEVYRDGNLIYKGYLSDFEDTIAIDKEIPNKVSTITTSFKKNKVTFGFNQPLDNGTTYNYQIKGTSDTGDTPLSGNHAVNVKSGIKGYSYVIDENPSTIPDNTIDTTSTTISKENVTAVKSYLHIKTIDNAGNVSEVTHQEITDNNAPLINAIADKQTVTQGDVTLTINATDNETGIKRIKLPNGNFTTDTSFTYKVSENGSYRFVAEDWVGNQTDYVAVIENIYEDFIFEAKANNADNVVELDWNNPFGIPSTYVVYRKNDSGEWESIPSKDKVKVLNIYPNNDVSNTGLSGGQIDLEGNAVPDSGILKTWLLKENIDDVEIDTLSLNSFNLDSDKFLKKENGVWNYDAVFYGMWNLSPATTYPNDQAVEYLRGFIQDGGGFMTSHHTIGYLALDKGVNKLADELGVEIFSNQTYQACSLYAGRDANGNMFPTVSFEMIESVACDLSSYWPSGTEIQIVKKGLLTEYPFKVGEVGEIYTIPYQHGLNVFAKGDVWLETANPKGFGGMPFKEINISPRTGQSGTNNFYVHTYNNTAIINSGHSFPSISEVETRIIANTLFYLAQTTTETSWVDRIGMDTAPPTLPTIKKTDLSKAGLKLTWSSEDVGVNSEYKVEARNSKFKVESNVETVEVKTGLKGYSYVIDNNPNTVPDNVVDTTTTSITLPYNKSSYLHIVSIDNVGNVSEVAHFEYKDTVAPSLNLSTNNSSWTTGNVIITAQASDTTTGIEGIQLPNGSWVDSNKATFTITENGVYTFVAKDFLGNQTTKSITISNIDRTAPTASTISNNTDWINANTVPVSITAGTDSQSGVSYVEYKLEEATIKGWTRYTGTFNVGNEGITKIIARTVDNMGHVSTETTSYVKIDRSKPYNQGIIIHLKGK